MSLAYRTGTVAVANGATSVTGTLTAWVNNVKQGDFARLPDGNLYEIAADPSINTSLTIVEPYAGTTVASGGNYAVFRFSSAWRPTAEISQRLGPLLDRFSSATGVFLHGTGVPSNALGVDGDLYIRTDVPELYDKASGSWGTGVPLTGPPGPGGPAPTATSTTSLPVGAGAKTLTTQAGRAFVVGSRIRVASAATPTTYMEGVVTTYTSTTLTFTSDRSNGSGSAADWNISLAGDLGSTGPQGAGYSTTSTASLLIGTGSKAFTGVGSTLGYSAGQRVRASSAANTANFMEGRVTSYAGGTLTVLVDIIGGSGTLADWVINIAGERGIQGVQGIQGLQGLTGEAGPGYLATSSSSIAIGVGAKSLTTQTGLAYASGTRVRIAVSTSTSNFMEGVCEYTPSTGAMTVDVDTSNGSGTFTSWTISVAGERGVAGNTFSHVGSYGSGTTYSLGETVLDQNSSWVYINATSGSGNAPPTLPTTSNSYWQLAARAGVDGTGSGTVTSVNGVMPVSGGGVTVAAEDVPVSGTFSNFTPVSGNVKGALDGVDSAIGAAGAPSLPQGRLTLTSGQPVLTANVVAATTVYYTPYAGQRCPIYNGTSFVMADIGGEMSQATTDATKSPAASAANKNYDIFVWLDGATYRATRGPAWSSDTSRGTGVNTSELERVKGILVNKQAITNGPAAQRGTYVGTIRTNASSQVDMRFVDVDAASNPATIGVWNMYQRVSTRARLIHNGGGTHTYSTSGWRQYGGSANSQINFVSGLAEDAIEVAVGAGVSNTATGDHFIGTQIDATTGAVVTYIRGLANSKLVGAALANGFAPQVGYHYISVNEIANVSGQAATLYQSLFSLNVTLRA